MRLESLLFAVTNLRKRFARIPCDPAGQAFSTETGVACRQLNVGRKPLPQAFISLCLYRPVDRCVSQRSYRDVRQEFTCFRLLQLVYFLKRMDFVH